MSKEFYYNLNKVIFKWSLIYFLVLIFLEDIKRSFVTSHFSPHIIVPVILLSGLLVFFINQHSNNQSKETEIQELGRRDNILIIILAVLAAAMTIKVFAFSFLGLIAGVIILTAVYYSVRFLYRELK